VAGGETTVTVRGSGRGGRNQEVALAAALELEGTSNLMVAALATDGTDGPTDAAGGIVDGETAVRARAAGFDPAEVLRQSNSHPLLLATGDLLSTGPTRTNVADLFFVFHDPDS
jgi:hydroxypyruvate reductase